MTNLTDSAVGLVTSVPIAMSATAVFSSEQVAYGVAAVTALITQVIIAFLRRKGWIQ